MLDRKTTTAATGIVIAATTTNLFRADIATATDYYAFGQPMPTRQYTATFAAAYRYGFNGKENDNSFDSKTIQDYGFRLYSPALCKFLSVDPLTAKYPELTPYQFASNTPIQAIDLDGLEAFFIHGTASSPQGKWFLKDGSINPFVNHIMRSTTNKIADLGFDWSGKNNGFTNNINNRAIEAKHLTDYVIKQFIASGGKEDTTFC